MKKNLTIILMLVTTLFYGQWVQVPNTLGGFVNDMYCISDNVVIAGGNNGYLAKTTDGGITWNTKISGTTSNVVKVQFANANVGYILLQNKTIIKTSNGGDTWSNAITTNILDISVVSPTILYTCNNDGHLLKSIDGGLNFVAINSTYLQGNIQFIDENVGFGLGSSLRRTIDGGITWTSIGDSDSRSFMQFFTTGLFKFISANVGFKIINNGIYKTIDGGNNFDYLCSVQYNIGHVIVPSENIFWGITKDLLLNGQPNFTTRVETLNNSLVAVDFAMPILNFATFASLNIGYALGFDGKFYKNTTGALLGTVLNQNNQKSQVYFSFSQKTIQIKLSDNLFSQTSIINILDNLGKKIFTSTYFNQVDVNIDSSSLSSGLYFVTILSESNSQTQKLIIN